MGDFDSVDPKVLAKIYPEKIIKLKKEKDFTDLEAAIEKAESLECLMCIFGALGERLDHTSRQYFSVSKQSRICLYRIQKSDRICYEFPVRKSADRKFYRPNFDSFCSEWSCRGKSSRKNHQSK
ncbi:MAG: hypothetical protein C5B45_01730 [Chlamydiae bacterium]|nr:MAG: hypothetical protein C5B45_01730 [Chlamydiota bacterium]